jgi:hypothetical protein
MEQASATAVATTKVETCLTRHLDIVLTAEKGFLEGQESQLQNADPAVQERTEKRSLGKHQSLGA